MSDDSHNAHPQQLAENVARAFSPGSKSLEQALSALSGAEPSIILGNLTAAAAEGMTAGLAMQAQDDERLHILGRLLREVHTEEMFGDCVEDGERYPCRTVRALDIVGAATPATSAAGD